MLILTSPEVNVTSWSPMDRPIVGAGPAPLPSPSPRSETSSLVAGPRIASFCSSASARAGTRICELSVNASLPSMSRMASRYESVATNRMPPASAATSTPVRRGRASSPEAARTTWRSAPARLDAGRKVTGCGGSGSDGKSSGGNVRRLKRDRAAPISIFSPSDSMVTAPGSSDRTMSASSFAGATHTPSEIPMTSVEAWTVRSRSVPTTPRWLACDSIRTPPRAIEVEVRELTARPAVVRTSTRESRSHRNFTRRSFLVFGRYLNFDSDGSKPCGLWISALRPSTTLVFRSAGHPPNTTD